MSETALKFSQKGAARERNGAPPLVSAGGGVEVAAPEKNASRNEAAGFPFWQSRLVTVLGVSEDLIRAGRAGRAGLVEGVDWCHQGQRVLFSERGVERLKDWLLVGGAAALPAVEEGEPVKLRVMRCSVNPHLVECVPADEMGMPKKGGARVVVRVRSNVNFMPGMLVRGMAIAGLRGVYGLVGACPRFRGRF